MLETNKFFLFDMTNGKKKLAYGRDPVDALSVLALRLDQSEMNMIITDSYKKILQKDLQKIVDDLG